MPDRIGRGLWPHAPLSFKAVADYLAMVLKESDAYFPHPPVPHRAGQVVWEGGTIERQENDRYVYRSSAVETVFTNARDAAVHYLKWTLNLPGDLDGWKVVNDE
jgi:hypothetical protein